MGLVIAWYESKSKKKCDGDLVIIVAFGEVTLITDRQYVQT